MTRFIYSCICILAIPCSRQDLSSQTRNWTHAACKASMDSQPLDSQRSPWSSRFKNIWPNALKTKERIHSKAHAIAKFVSTVHKETLMYLEKKNFEVFIKNFRIRMGLVFSKTTNIRNHGETLSKTWGKMFSNLKFPTPLNHHIEWDGRMKFSVWWF